MNRHILLHVPLHTMPLPLVSLLCLLIPSTSHGAGFAILQQGTGPMGQGNAFVAQADDPSAVFFNPAGITQLDGTRAYLGTTFIVPRITYDGADGSFEDTVAKLYATPPRLFHPSDLAIRLPRVWNLFSVRTRDGLG